MTLKVHLPYRTFAPVWDVFKVSTEKLAGCHMDLARRLQDLIKEVQKYAEEQTKAHKKVLLLLSQLQVCTHFLSLGLYLWVFFLDSSGININR